MSILLLIYFSLTIISRCVATFEMARKSTQRQLTYSNFRVATQDGLELTQT